VLSVNIPDKDEQEILKLPVQYISRVVKESNPPVESLKNG